MTTTFEDRSPKSEQLSDDGLATVCAACGHDESLHDATGTRFCRASLDRAVDRGVSSVRGIFDEGLKARKVEACVLAGHFAAYFSAVFLVLSPLTAVVFIVVHQCLWGIYMGCSWILSSAD
jgi:hypothetical protein